MYTIPAINPLDYRFHLPEDFVPDRPLPERDQSKLLLYKDGSIAQTVFKDLPYHLPKGVMLVFNNSKVIPARMHFRTPNGALIEVFCLQAIGEELVNEGISSQRWKCIIGNLKRWKSDDLKIETSDFIFSAKLLVRGGDDNEVQFSWTGTFTFLEILEQLGRIPLPPYMNRDADESDIDRYQTVYAASPGSVAAPTAGLHFTSELLLMLNECKILQEQVTLHVGAGTFKPIKAESVAEHRMHQEFFEVEKALIEKLLVTEMIIPVGTTSMRTLESLFHLGNQLLNGDEQMSVLQWAGFSTKIATKEECLNALLEWLNKNDKTRIIAETSIMIVPGYEFRMCKGIITNFHQPESTLILLVAALLGEKWREVYDYALENKFRFLSYGDSSLLLCS